MLADYRKPDMHRHLCSHLAFVQKGKLSCETAYGKLTAEGVFIDSDVSHTIASAGEPIVLFMFDENSAIGRRVKSLYLSDAPVVAADDRLVVRLRQIFAGLGEGLPAATDGVKSESCEVIVDASLRELLGEDEPSCGRRKRESGMDARIEDILDYLERLDGIEGDIVEKLAARECLSKSRLSHLFTSSVGVSLHRYLSFMKLKKASTYIMQGRSMTDAALLAGFDSSSHFSSTMRRMFGISLTDVQRSMKTAAN